ncbi:B12-binding domain-containing radical SAM protein [Methanocella arvoryzae]|uniref:Predicted Fe-S cluster-binding oxidoreductase n=1 Tax=Methanocella arvoryzae (strain DSM 22066 / NBRC 105507 / MRE50) TaxID=351160 RepID=Q0W7F7_METAR|nr:radical SAM protein [Methanocella arvoryzae]CAJ35686.1 predicted Fe-S cluster-binding oxidoreductase [Methanocella arvoryzae MRE50]
MRVMVLNPPSRVIKNVVRDLIYGCWCSGKRIGGASTPPLNLLYIATVLKSAGHEVTLLDAIGEGRTLEYVKSKICNYDCLIISTSTMSFHEDADILKELKSANPLLTTIIFGSHPTFMPGHCLSEESVDVTVINEPEITIRELVEQIGQGDDRWKSVKGIGYTYNGRPIINESRPFIENLDELPFPDRTLLPQSIDYFHPLVRKMPYATMMTSRGCPGSCNFCTVGRFYGKKIRSRSTGNIISEIEIIHSQGYREIFFRDETFTFFKDRNKKFCEELINRKYNLSWIANARVGTIDYETARLMKQAGCHTIKIGVESGVQRILNNIKKGITVENTKKTFKILKEAGIDTHAHMMIGCPGETRETIDETLKFIKEICPTTVTMAICTPYPGTELFDIIMREHPEIGDGSDRKLSNVHVSGYYNQYFTDLSNEDIEKYLKRVYQSFYLRPAYWMKWMGKIRNADDAKRIMLAGLNVFNFALER